MVFQALKVSSQVGRARRARVRAVCLAQLAGELLGLKNHTYECWTLVKPTLNSILMHKYPMYLIWLTFVNLKPTLQYSHNWLFKVQRIFLLIFLLGIRRHRLNNVNTHLRKTFIFFASFCKSLITYLTDFYTSPAKKLLIPCGIKNIL